MYSSIKCMGLYVESNVCLIRDATETTVESHFCLSCLRMEVLVYVVLGFAVGSVCGEGREEGGSRILVVPNVHFTMLPCYLYYCTNSR